MSNPREHELATTFRRILSFLFILITIFSPLTTSFSTQMLRYHRVPRLHTGSLLRCKATKVDRISMTSLIGKWVTLASDSTKCGQITASKGGWFTISLRDSNTLMKLRNSQFQLNDEVSANEIQNTGIVLNSDSPADVKVPQTFSLPVIEPPAMHKACPTWIVFSDLHVKDSSIEICEEILYKVNEEAQKHNAGIIFLGDFWHVRGSLSVDLLNRVLKVLRTWTQPVIMIPGNHDQVTLGGTVHALEPLKYAFPPEQIMMLDEPAICLGALWIPYRRDKFFMKAVLDNAWNRTDISMIFCHADVKGAWMNDNIQSREGLDVSAFPPSIPIFSGHFHKPHLVSRLSHSLRYVGSPYQTSLSEADQIKYFYKLTVTPTTVTNISDAQHNTEDSQNAAMLMKWKEESKWPINKGRKYYKITDIQDPKLSLVQKGDRVIFTTTFHDHDAVDTIARKLRLDGVEVEIRSDRLIFSKTAAMMSFLSATNNKLVTTSVENNNTTKEGIDGIAAAAPSETNNTNETAVLTAESILMNTPDEMEPITLFKTYMQDINPTIIDHLQNTSLPTVTSNHSTETAGVVDNITSPTSSNTSNFTTDFVQLKEEIVQKGQAILEQISNVGTISHGVNGGIKNGKFHRDIFNLQLNTVSLQNFGPYGGKLKIDYPLSKRGLVLIRGRVIDTTGADSNGSGKTTLAMSILWCLTGSMDTRLSNDMRTPDVTYDIDMLTPSSGSSRKASSASPVRTAEVTLSGEINQVPFQIIRRKSSKKQELYFQYNGEDMTTQSVKDTQSVIESKLGIGKGLLQRGYFFGQHSHTAQSLLGLTDSKLKDELSILANVDIWNQAIVTLRGQEKLLKQQLQELLITMKLQSTELLLTKQAQIRTTKTQLQTIQDEMRSLEAQLVTIQEEFLSRQYLQIRGIPTDWSDRLTQVSQNDTGVLSAKNISISNIQEELQLLQAHKISMEKDKESFVQGTLEPLKTQYLQALAALNTPGMNNQKARNTATSMTNSKKSMDELEQAIQQQEKLLTEIASKMEYLTASKIPLEKKLHDEMIPQMNKLFLQAYGRIVQALPTPSSSSTRSCVTLSDFQPIFTKYLEKTLMQLLSVMEQFYLATPNNAGNKSPAPVYTESNIQQRVQQLSSFYQTQQEDLKMKLSSIQEKIASIHASIHQYHDHGDATIAPFTDSVPTIKQKQIAPTAVGNNGNGMIKEKCPTCHQPLPLAQIQAQLKTLQGQLTPLVQQQAEITHSLASNASVHHILQEIFIPFQQSLSFLHQEKSLTQQRVQDMSKQLISLVQQQDQQVKPLLQGYQQEYHHAKQIQESQITSFQQAYEQAEKVYLQMQQRIQEYTQYTQQVQNLCQHVIHTLLPPLHTQRTIKETQQQMFLTQLQTLEREYAVANETFQGYEQQKQGFQRELLILNQLMHIFGNRGIQHYLYTTSLLQLEYFANEYLTRMTEQGGMILRLKSLVDPITPMMEGSSSSSSAATAAAAGIDKIMKSVYIRKQHARSSSMPDDVDVSHSSPTTPPLGQDPLVIDYKERALSQLSGGQWRRVSLALDLAFTEVIKRRGLLRCNILVLDEILTHLDAQGREAVGSVLKSLVEGSQELQETPSSSSSLSVEKDSELVEDAIAQVEGEGDSSSSNRTSLGANERKAMKTSKGHSFESIFIILQDLVANELEESFDSIDTVVKEGDSSHVEIDQH